MQVIAHRGAAFEAPENSLAAFRRARELGADAFELDVRGASDGLPVVIHDATLERTTHEVGPVARRSAASLRSVRHRWPPAAREDGAARREDRDLADVGGFPEDGIPLLEEVFDLYPAVSMTVDVKEPELAGTVVALIGAFDRSDRTVLYVERGTRSRVFRTYAGPRATSTRQALRLAKLWRWVPGLPGSRFPEVVHTPVRRGGLRVVTRGLVRCAHRTGRVVHVWTVDEAEAMRRLARLGVDGLITNDVRTAVSLREGHAGQAGRDGPSDGSTGGEP